MAIGSISNTSQQTGSSYSSYMPSCKTVIKVVVCALMVFSNVNAEPAGQQFICRPTSDTSSFEVLNAEVVNGTAQNQYFFVFENKKPEAPTKQEEPKKEERDEYTRSIYETTSFKTLQCRQQGGLFWGMFC